MRTIVLIDGDEFQVEQDSSGEFARVAGKTCGACGKDLEVVGKGISIGGFDYYRASGFCKECRAPVGEIRAYMDTLFGVEEDDRVLNGRCRVY